jgi:hypothetical protein
MLLQRGSLLRPGGIPWYLPVGLTRYQCPASISTQPGPKGASGRPDGGQPLHLLALCHASSSVGRISFSLTATRRGRVTLYWRTSALSSAASCSQPQKRCLHDVLTHRFPYLAQALSRDGPRLDHRDAHGSRTTSD